MPKISVIIPTYNCFSYIKEAVDSVLNQTYQNIEIIIVDDGSTDNTMQLLTPYSSQIKYIHQQNRGPSAARNTGIRAAQGEWIAFLDADDIWLPNKLEKQILLAEEKNELDVIFTDFYYLCENGKNFKYRTGFEYHSSIKKLLTKKVSSSGKIITGEIFSSILKDFFINFSTVLIRRRCFEATGELDESLLIAEDLQLWLRLSKQFKFGFIDECLVKNKIREGNLSWDFEKSMSCRKAMLENLHYYIAQLSNKEIKAVRKEDAKCNYSLGYLKLEQELLQEARNYFLNSTKLSLGVNNLTFYCISILPLKVIRLLRKLKNFLATILDL